MFILWFHTVCFLIMLNSVKSEVFSATADVEPLLKTQEKVIYDLEGYINMEKKRLNALETNLKSYKKEHKKAMEDVPNYIGNPVNCYTLIKRLTTDLEFIENSSNMPIEFDKDDALLYPTREDLDGAIKALSRLQDTYLLNTTLLAGGVLSGTFSHGSQPYTEKFTPMSASDCYEIGTSLYSAENYKSAIDWLMEAFWKYDNDQPGDYSFTVVGIVEQIADAYLQMDDIRNALKWTQLLLAMKPSNLIDASAINAAIEQLEKRIADEDEENTRLEKFQIAEGEPSKQKQALQNHEDSQNAYEGLCRGELDSPSIPSKRLTCRYLTGDHPFLKIAPIKMEELFTEPKISIFYEVLTDDDINVIKEESQPNFERATVQGEVKVVSKHRTSKSAWLSDDNDVVARVSHRVSDFTGMSMTFAEELQVSNYGIGGHFATHHDFFEDDKRANGNRIGTVLFYMSDVAQGGATVFTKLGLTVFPVKGAAVFWWNLHPSGEKDRDTRHAACPVLRGSKWVSNKWIRQRGQELLKPCNLEYQDENLERKIPRPAPKSSF